MLIIETSTARLNPQVRYDSDNEFILQAKTYHRLISEGFLVIGEVRYDGFGIPDLVVFKTKDKPERSLDTSKLTEEQKIKLRAAGYLNI